jgi:hypothetical protein
MIKRNAMHCLACDQVVESKHVHDFKECKCGNVFVDGGHEYLRWGIRDFSTVVSLSEVDEDEDEDEDEDNSVCLHHKRFVPCRPCLRLEAIGEDFISEWTDNPEAVEIVSQYQRGEQ